MTHAYTPDELEWGELLPELEIYPPARQRRLTVVLRLILAIPHVLIVAVLGVVAFVVRILGWISALILGRLPLWCGNFLRGYLAYAVRVNGYLWFLVDAYPPFAWNPSHYAIHVEFPPPTRLNRWAVLFRTILAFPIMVLMGFFTAGWGVVAVLIWLIVFFLGRVPRPIFEASAAILRISLRTQAYYLLLTPAYLKGIWGDSHTATGNWHHEPLDENDEEHEDYSCPTRPLHLSSGGRNLMIVLLVLGILSYIAQAVVRVVVAAHSDIPGTSQQNDAIGTIRDYYDAVNDNDGQKACGLLSPALATALMAASRVDNCPAAIDTTVKQQGADKTQELADFRYDARDVVLSDSDSRAVINVRDILKLNGKSTELNSEIKLQKNDAGEWILTSLG